MCCSFLDGLVLPSLTGSLHKYVTAAVKPRHSKCQAQDQDSSHEEVLDLINSQRWQKHQKNKVYHQEEVKSTPNSPTQLITCRQHGRAGSSPPSSCSWALLELRELFLVNEPTAFRNLAPLAAAGYKKFKQTIFTLWPPRPGLPSQVTSCKAVWGSKCQDWWEEAISSFFLWYQPFQRTHMWLQAPSSGATVPCHGGRRSGASVQTCSVGQASSETAATRVQP